MSQFAFFFPGQGSQSVGMMSGLEDLDIIKQTFVEASDTLNVDFWTMVTAPKVMAGHSLAEYTALVAAEAISFKDALPLVKYRAEVMQTAVPEGKGGMAAILGLDDEAVKAVCSEAAEGDVVEAVNFNCSGQVVIAGERNAVERAMELAKAKGAKRALPLPVSVPSHCALMKPAADKLVQYLVSVNINTPKINVLHNADVASYQDA